MYVYFDSVDIFKNSGVSWVVTDILHCKPEKDFIFYFFEIKIDTSSGRAYLGLGPSVPCCL